MLIQRPRFAWLVNAQCDLGFPVGQALAANSERGSRARHFSIPAQFYQTENLLAPSTRPEACTLRLNRPVYDYKVTHHAKTQVFRCAAMDAIQDKYL